MTVSDVSGGVEALLGLPVAFLGVIVAEEAVPAGAAEIVAAASSIFGLLSPLGGVVDLQRPRLVWRHGSGGGRVLI